jgi:hypothetical protein
MMADLYMEFDTKLRSSLVAWCILNKAMRGDYLRRATPTIRLELKEVEESLPCKELKMPAPSGFDVAAVQERLKALGLRNACVRRWSDLGDMWESDEIIYITGV